MELTVTSWILGLAAALLVGFSKTGLPGLGILIVPMMAAVFPAKLSVGALVPMLLLGDMFAIARYRRHTQWRKLWRLLPFVFIGMIPARFVLAGIPNEPFKLVLGMLVLLLVLLELARRRFNWERIPRSLVFAAIMGILAGFATTMGNVAGPIMSVYLLSMGLDKHEFIGTGAWFYPIVNATKVPIYAQLGMITADTLRFDLISAPLIIMGALVGMIALPKIPQKVFAGLIFVLAAIAALGLIYTVLYSGGI
jgi:uncharacterized membrane protein YfcA